MASISTALDGIPDVVDVPTKYGLLSLCPRPLNKHRTKKESAVWQYGKTYSSKERPGVVRCWRCDRCKEFIPLSEGRTSNADRHLQKRHNIFVNAQPHSVASTDVESNVESVIESSSVVESTRSQRPLIAEMLFSPRIKEWRRDLLIFLLVTHTPFNVVNTPEFRRWQLSTSAALEPYLPSNVTVREWAGKEFDVGRRKISMILKEALFCGSSGW